MNECKHLRQNRYSNIFEVHVVCLDCGKVLKDIENRKAINADGASNQEIKGR